MVQATTLIESDWWKFRHNGGSDYYLLILLDLVSAFEIKERKKPTLDETVACETRPDVFMIFYMRIDIFKSLI